LIRRLRLAHAQPVPLSDSRRRDRRNHLRRDFRAGEFREPENAGNDRYHSGRQVSQEIAARVFRMRSKASDAQLVNLFLDMLAAEQGAGKNTLDAYRRDLTDFSEVLGRKGQNFTGAGTDELRDYLADLDIRGFKSSSVARRLSAMRHLFRLLLNERTRSEDPAAI